MKREEAIKMLRGMKAENLNLANLYTKDRYNALDMAIKALEQEPCEDAISRKDVIKAVDLHTFDTDIGLCLDNDISCIVENLPPVTPKGVTVTEFADRCRECGREKVLDKIKVEVERERMIYLEMNDIDWLNGCDYVLSVIDKHKKEMESEE